MFTKTIEFEDLNGDTRRQTFHFNYSKKEIAELLEFGMVRDFARYRGKERERIQPLEDQMARLTKPISESGLTQVENSQQAYDIFQELILGAYGVKSSDNTSFEKSPANWSYFENHVAFVEMIFEFLIDTSLINDFIEGCLPAKLVAEAKKDAGVTNISEMSAEAARRQEDPETRIEPGDYSHLDPSPEVVRLAEQTAASKQELTEEEILTMPQHEFEKLDPRKIPPHLLPVAFRRKVS